MSALLLVHRDTGGVTNIPFTYKDGQMMEAIEAMADFIVGAGMVDSFWEGVAADRLGIVLRQNVEIKDLKTAVAELREWSAFVGHPVKEMVT